MALDQTDVTGMMCRISFGFIHEGFHIKIHRDGISVYF